MLNRGEAGVALSPDGHFVAVIGPGPNRTEAELRKSGAGFLELYDGESGTPLRRVKTPWPRSRVVFSPDGHFLAAGGSRITLWSLPTLDQISSMPTSDGSEASALEFLPDSRHLVGASGSTLRLWDVARREEILKFDPADGDISRVAVVPDGTRIRYVASRRVAELNLWAFAQHIEGNLDWQAKRIRAEITRSGDTAGIKRLRARVDGAREMKTGTSDAENMGAERFP
jgi:WD40 repeat protein